MLVFLHNIVQCIVVCLWIWFIFLITVFWVRNECNIIAIGSIHIRNNVDLESKMKFVRRTQIKIPNCKHFIIFYCLEHATCCSDIWYSVHRKMKKKIIWQLALQNANTLYTTYHKHSIEIEVHNCSCASNDTIQIQIFACYSNHLRFIQSLFYIKIDLSFWMTFFTFLFSVFNFSMQSIIHRIQKMYTNYNSDLFENAQLDFTSHFHAIVWKNQRMSIVWTENKKKTHSTQTMDDESTHT